MLSIYSRRGLTTDPPLLPTEKLVAGLGVKPRTESLWGFRGIALPAIVPPTGFEPVTIRVEAGCSSVELRGQKDLPGHVGRAHDQDFINLEGDQARSQTLSKNGRKVCLTFQHQLSHPGRYRPRNALSTTALRRCVSSDSNRPGSCYPFAWI